MSATTKCTKTYHEGLKRFPLLWGALTKIGEQNSGDPETYLELRNCSCGSTLALELPKKA